MEILIDKNYKITTVKLNFVLEKRVPESKNNKGEPVPEFWKVDGYYSSIQSLLKGYLKKSLLEDTEIKSFDELYQKLDNIEKTISKVKIENDKDKKENGGV